MLAKTLFSVLAVLSVNAQSITTPAAVIQCQPAQFTLSGGTAPYIVDVIPAGQVSAPAIAFIGDDLPAGSLTWTPDLPAGTNVTFRITDSNGSPQYSYPVVIQQGSSDSCLNSSVSTSGLATGAITTTNTASVSASSGASSSAPASTTSAPSSSMTMSSSSGGGLASSISNSVSSAASGASSAVSGASGAASSAAATSSPNGASPTGIAGAGALAAGIIGGVAMLF